MCNRLGTFLFWGVMIFVLLFLAAALSMPAHAGTVGVDNVGLWLNITGIALFWIISLWPVGSLLTVRLQHPDLAERQERSRSTFLLIGLVD